MRILLVVDQDGDQSSDLATSLGGRGARTYCMTRADLSWTVLRDADIILLGPHLSRDERVAICGEVRLISNIPIIMISDRMEREDLIESLRAGADNYVVSPYHFDELMAKIVAATRPRDRTGDQKASEAKTRQIGDIEIDLERMKVTVAGVATELTKKEFQLLTAIAGENGNVCPREKLAAEVWGRSEEQVYDSIQVLMSRLRVKLGRDRIKTVRSVGYRIETPPGTSGRPAATYGRP